MHRVGDYQKNAAQCRELAARMPAAAAAQLMEMARNWEDLAEERARYLALRGPTDEPDPLIASPPEPKA